MVIGALDVTLDTTAGNPGDDLLVTVATAGTVSVASDLAASSSVVSLPDSGQISVGKLAPGVYALNIFQDTNQFFTFLTILPDGSGQLAVTQDSFFVPRNDVETFSDDILTKFLNNLDANRLENAWHEAVTDNPTGAAAAIGLVIAFGVASVIAGEALAGAALVTGLVAAPIAILGLINDKLIEDMKSDGSLQPAEADFLSLLWGTRALLGGLTELSDAEKTIAKLQSAFETADAVKDLVTTSGDIELGASVEASTVQVPRGMVFVKINSLPQSPTVRLHAR